MFDFILFFKNNIIMSDLTYRIKKRKFQKARESFAVRYRHCNRCKKSLNIQYNEEIVCALCGETFCFECINPHQKYCYSGYN